MSWFKSKQASQNKNFFFDIFCYLYLVSKSAPYWEGKAVVNGEFKDLKLTDFKGMSMNCYILYVSNFIRN